MSLFFGSCIFNVYVRPLVEYNSVVWSPYRKCDIVAVENVKRKFTKRLPGFVEHSYSKRLSLLKLPSLDTSVALWFTVIIE